MEAPITVFVDEKSTDETCKSYQALRLKRFREGVGKITNYLIDNFFFKLEQPILITYEEDLILSRGGTIDRIDESFKIFLRKNNIDEEDIYFKEVYSSILRFLPYVCDGIVNYVEDIEDRVLTGRHIQILTSLIFRHPKLIEFIGSNYEEIKNGNLLPNIDYLTQGNFSEVVTFREYKFTRKQFGEILCSIYNSCKLRNNR